MKEKLKHFVKRTIPASIIELFLPKKVGITKFPQNQSVISDLFIFRIEENWETYFELLNVQNVISPGTEAEVPDKATVFFFNNDGKLISYIEVDTANEMKRSININFLAKELKIKQDGLFSVFHHNPPQLFDDYNSFLAERGYTAYVNPIKGKIKSFVHGNLDSISLGKHNKTKLLGELSFKEKEYHLQHLLEANNMYELFIVNPSNKIQTFEVIEQSGLKQKKHKLIIPSGGVRKFIKPKNNSNSNTRIIIKSKLSLARPVVFKYMETSFDIFHG